MDSIVLEEAFSMWKVFDEFVETLLKPIDKGTIQKLANMVMSKEFSKTFLYNREPGISYQDFIEIVDKYRTFTTRLLGQFFYLLSCDDDEIIVDAQLSILNQLSKAHLDTYNILANEYCKSFDYLISYLKNPKERYTFCVFNFKSDLDHTTKKTEIEVSDVRVCLKLIKKMLRILGFILAESITYYSVESEHFSALDNIVCLLEYGYFEEKIMNIVADLIDRLKFHSTDWIEKLLIRIRSIFSLLEQAVYDFYSNRNSKNYNKHEFEIVLGKYLKSCRNLKPDINQNYGKICSFILKFTIETLQKNVMDVSCLPSRGLQKLCAEDADKLKSLLCDDKLLINALNVSVGNNNFVIFSLCNEIILQEIYTYNKAHPQVKKLYMSEASKTWTHFCKELFLCINNLQCNENCCEMHKKLDFLINLFPWLLSIKIKFSNHHTNLKIYFFNDIDLLPTLISNMSKHCVNCKNHLDLSLFFKVLVKHLGVSECNNIDIIYNLVLCPYLVPLCYKSEAYMSCNYIGNIPDRAKFKSDIKSLYACLVKSNCVNLTNSLTIINEFFSWISSGILDNLNEAHVEQIQMLHMKVLKKFKDNEPVLRPQVVESIPNLLHLFSNRDEILTSVLNPLFSSKEKVTMLNIAEVLPTILCTSNSDFHKIINTHGFEIVCDKCNLRSKSLCKEKNLEACNQNEADCLKFTFSKIRVDMTSAVGLFLRTIISFITGNNLAVKIKGLEALPSLSQHIPKFYSVDVTKIWIELLGDSNMELRRKLSKIISEIINNGESNSLISEANKAEVLDIIFSVLLRLTKKSLQYSEYDLQDTLLTTIDEICSIDSNKIKLECLKILFYLVMVPTSAQSFLAINTCSKISEKDTSGYLLMYKHNAEMFCEVIVHLCYVNQHLVNWNLQESLVKISPMLGFNGVKDFLAKEAENLLPYLVTKVVKSSKVPKLIEEMAVLVDVNISDLLSKNYGNIFLHLVLSSMEKPEVKTCLNYLEKTTRISGPKLRKMNLRVILNELLINFHEKREKVIAILQLLLQEDNTSQAKKVEDYLQPFFLAFLLYFDLEMSSEYSKKEKLLLSLADLFKFLGPSRITPLRFKILAMLQTAHYLKYPELTCAVWNSFMYSCDIECLGPHLATIFVSMMPLIQHCPNEINKIFQYLVVTNEMHLKDYIADLFFINNSYLSSIVLNVVKKYVTENISLKDKIKKAIKYLKHDTLEVRIQSLKHLKTWLEQNREELDQMILGYNGIDNIIVELIDHLTLGCREKDETLKLTCGEIFGELGAIEPSHLPRRYAQDNKSFIYFINEDPFIESALNELIKAFQTDNNARNTDRVALAIQEIIKTYGISPQESSTRHFMWKKFSEAQREVMQPLLSSKYICVENISAYPCPLYGSRAGASFQAWLYNWTSSLISTLPEDRRYLLQSCFPSMKLDKRVLMHFLPYILLHSLIDGNNGSEDKSFTEFQTVLSSFNCTRAVDEKMLNVRPIPIPGNIPAAREVTAEEEKQVHCTKIVFILLDFLDRWLREWQWFKGQSAETDRNYQTIKRFLKKFCKLDLAKCNFKCEEYSRALMYLEEYMTENSDDFFSNLPFLAEIYAQLNEPDGVLGIEQVQDSEPPLEQRLLSLEVAGKLGDAAAIYEHMPRPLKLQHIQGLIQCYLDLDKVNTALYFAKGAIDLQPEFGNMLLEMQAEPLWRLGKYDDLENLLTNPDVSENKSWGVQIGKSLVCIKKGERNEFKSILESIKKQQVDSFGASSLEEGAYQHGYSYITRLHYITELEQIEKALAELLLKPNDVNYAGTIIKKLANEWQLRIKVVQESPRIIEQLLSERRVALSLGRAIAEKKAPHAIPFFDELLGECWLQSVKIARSSGAHQQAFTYVLDAEKYNPPKLFLEKAKLHWLRKEHEEALITLKRGLNVYIPDNASSQEAREVIATLGLEKRKLCAEARLLIASYNDSICSVDVDMNLQQYKDSIEAHKEWEKSIVCLAQYQDRIFQNYSDDEKDTRASDLQLHIVHNFGKSLYFGTTYIYQSIPRLLSVWFDYGTRLLNVSNSAQREERRMILVKMTKIIDTFVERLPAFVFLTSFSQIISRIAHPQKEIYYQLKSIIIKLLHHYPQQCLWMISSVIKSSYPMRAKRCAEILNDSRLKTHVMTKLVKDFTSLAEKLIELCNKEIPQDVNNTTVSLLVRALPRMLNQAGFSEIMMPTHKFRKLILPNPDFKNSQHNPFPNHYVHIVGIDDDITVLTSLQRPRKISLRGSDGKGYVFMLKPKDDLRKDFRLMEFNDIVNHLLLRDPEARQRRLNIRLYSVAPLNEECGLIEWVPNLLGLRPVLMNLYKQRGLAMRPKELKDICCNVKDPLAKKREVFTKILLKKHPPVLGEWFRKTFPDAQTWLTARTGYIRTTAVISITGYILGLGDRHGENILLDSTGGDVVHVDFNCLFNKGETFEWPERVPFRLTQNMVSAMGPLGIEGIFKKSCEFTLRVLRSNTSTLMSIVTPFVYDPLVSWPRNVPAAAQSTERVNEQALEHVKNIELRLQGKVKTRSRSLSQCLSVEGQTDYLIKEAMSIDNLCQMYIGWGPYL